MSLRDLTDCPHYEEVMKADPDAVTYGCWPHLLRMCAACFEEHKQVCEAVKL